MSFDDHSNVNLENFDDLWSLGDPITIEKKFRTLLPHAQALKDQSTYLQLLSQIALTEALQRKFNDAHKTLDEAEEKLVPKYVLAHIRILLERGRIFQQAGNIAKAKSFFEKSYKLSAKNKFDFHTINAAHMIAIVAKKSADKIKWNKLALKMAQKTKTLLARKWCGSLYNNLGQNYLEAHQFENALAMFKKALAEREKDGYAPNIRVAKWAIASALRSLGQLDKALTILQKLCKEYDAIAQGGRYDMPEEAFTLTRGLVYEELAHTYKAKAKMYANLAYADLSSDVMFKKMEAKRLAKLKSISSS